MKGQTAVEYLMTYGWAILIILIVAGVLAYYGIFQPQGFLGPTARGFGQLQVLNPWSLTNDGTITINVQNQVGGPVTPTYLNVTVSGVTGPGTCTPTVTPSPITSGSQGIVTCALSGLGTMPGSGKPYTATVTIGYDFSGNPFTTTGTLSGTLG